MDFNDRLNNLRNNHHSDYDYNNENPNNLNSQSNQNINKLEYPLENGNPINQEHTNITSSYIDIDMDMAYNNNYNNQQNEKQKMQFSQEQYLNSNNQNYYNNTDQYNHNEMYSYNSRNIVLNIKNQKDDKVANYPTSKRLFAFLIDFLITRLPAFFILLVSIIPTFLTTKELYGTLTGEVWDIYGSLILKFGFICISQIIINIIYFCFLPYYFLKNQTIGKRMANLKVIDKDLQNEVTLKQLVIRETIGKFLSLISIIGYFMILFDKHNKKALHDRIAKTIVVDSNQY